MTGIFALRDVLETTPRLYRKPLTETTAVWNAASAIVAIDQHRADWGLAIESVARANGLGFLPYQEERYDFVIPKSRRDRPAMQTFIKLLAENTTKQRLIEFGFRPSL